MTRLRPIVADSLLVVLLAAVTFISLVVNAEQCGCGPLTAGPAAVLGLQLVPLVWRRRWPLATWAVTSLAAGAYGWSDWPDPPLFFGPIVALYTVANYCRRRTAIAVGMATAVVTAALVLLAGDLADLAFTGLTFTTAWVLGDAARVRRDQAADAAGEAAAAERVRIARELHDVVAHHVSVIAIQAEAAQEVLAAQPARAAQAMAAVSSTARQALDELRRLLVVLRDPAESGSPGAPRGPSPDLGALEDLVGSVRAAGLPVDVVVEGERRPLPAGVGLSAYRILQESLTNVLRHAGATQASVTVRYGEQELVVRVRDDGNGNGNEAPGGSGHGIAGMRERVAMLGGDLRAGRGDGGGFEVEARLPV